ncbi:hypothetical protein [Actinoplanes xinjiangensis]|uniref:Uncharacterized protein n=1 Tax=Actinoplanes xinjiangensis TaxID=512350 RepID=A0A316FR51_9ACTN|nr:hypothetical protein [Actinoplanes xinjiangensis]PWK41674.1 hypothetical protein BC793_116147 [Actinoplanes xinjiangensis]GIF41920.1 hypothetical protein Axi01nite_62310 [Actinoplanes xinjiangensis]
MTADTAPVRCLTIYCIRPATHWHDGAPYCLDCAWICIHEEGRIIEPAPGVARDFARYYTDRDLNPHRRDQS